MNSRRWVLLLCFALAEASVIEPGLMILPTPLRIVDHGVALLVTVLLLSAIAFSRQMLAQRDASLGTQRLVLGLWLVGLFLASTIIIIATLHLDPRSLGVLFVQFTGVLLIWWRGIAIGVSHFTPDDARLRLQIGLLLFVLFAMMTALSPQTDLLDYLLPFVVGAVCALPLSHIEYVDQNPQGRAIPMDAKWWRTVAMGAGVPLAISIALTALINGDAIGSGLRLLLTIVMIPILAIAFVFGYIISILLSLLLGQIKRNPLEALQGFGQLLQQNTRPDNNAPPPIVLSPELRYALGILALAAVITLLLWLTGRARKAAAVLREGGEDLQDLGVEPLPPPSVPGADLLNILNLRRWLAALTIRRIYARMSHEAGKRGFVRLPAQTPLDYLPHAGLAFPGGDADLRIITDAYVAAHYGEVPDTEEALQKIRSAWDRVRAIPRMVLLETEPAIDPLQR